MSMYIKSVELYLENCENIFIDVDDILNFDIGTITTKYQNALNCIYKSNVVDSFHIGIRQGANLEKSTTFNNVSIERLALLDVTHVYITYENDVVESYVVKWDSECEYKNDKQVYHLTPEGNILFYSYTGERPSNDLIDDWCSAIDFKGDITK